MDLENTNLWIGHCFDWHSLLQYAGATKQQEHRWTSCSARSFPQSPHRRYFRGPGVESTSSVDTMVVRRRDASWVARLSARGERWAQSALDGLGLAPVKMVAGCCIFHHELGWSVRCHSVYPVHGHDLEMWQPLPTVAALAEPCGRPVYLH